MKWLLDLRTMVKLGASFAVMAVLLATVGWTTLGVASSANASLETVSQRDLVGMDLAGRAQVDRLKVTRAYLLAMLETDDAARAGRMREIDDAFAAFNKELDDLEPLTIRAEQKLRIAEARKGLAEYVAATRRTVETYRADPVKGAEQIKTTSAIGARVGDVLEQYLKVKREVGRESAEAAAAQYASGRNVALALTFGAMAFAVLMAFVVGGSIATPLKTAVSVLERVSKGDLSARLELDRKDEVGMMAIALNRSLESVRSTLASVQSVSVDVSNVSAQLAASAQQISAGSQEQAASLEETAASLEEISSTVKQNTDNAQHAAQLASGARDAAERGGQVVGTAVSAMNEITKSSKKIADIITTIDEIAFQTNLLALNAAVEAARAGEQGRGFGVVAAEVRSLAQRTGAAAKEIRGLIADSSSKVEVGTLQVNESGKTLEEIVRSVKKVTDMVAEIAAASREQNAGIEQVNTAVTQVDQVTQLNAAQTEELSATATSLSEKSEQLQGLVAAFQLGEGAAPQAARPVAAARKAAAPPRLRAVRAASGVVRTAKAAPPPLKAAGGYEEF